MNLFYNKEGIGDTLLVSLSPETSKEWSVEKRGNVARIYDAETGVTLGFNFFDASHYFTVEGQGPISYNQTQVDELNQHLNKVGFDYSLTFSSEPDFVVGFVKKMDKHPNADKLKICQVDVGTAELQIVCGAPNVAEGQKVVVARVGAVMPSGTVIKEAELRGVPSSGMICSARELDLPNAPQEKGILVLEDSKQVGEAFFTL